MCSIMSGSWLKQKVVFILSSILQLYSDFLDLLNSLNANTTKTCCFNNTEITVLNLPFETNSDPIPAVESVFVSLSVFYTTILILQVSCCTVPGYNTSCDCSCIKSVMTVEQIPMYHVVNYDIHQCEGVYLVTKLHVGNYTTLSEYRQTYSGGNCSTIVMVQHALVGIAVLVMVQSSATSYCSH